MNSFWSVYRSVTAVANDLILVEMIVGNTFCFYSPFPFGLNFDQGFGDISWQACPKVLGMLTPKSVKDFLVSLLSVLLLDLAIDLWTMCLTSLLWSRKCSLLVLSRVTLLQSLIL